MGIEFYPYNSKFPKIFTRKRDEIKSDFKDCEIHHIGSTAVPGIGGKGVVDIMVTLSDWKKEKELLKNLKKLGYTHVHERKEGRRFVTENSGRASEGGVHIHITKKGNKEYKKLLSFRNCLRANPEVARKYNNLKKKLEGKPPEIYNQEKSKFFEDINFNNYLLSGTFQLNRGDITKQSDLDAIVNATNASLSLGGGASGAIHRVAGLKLHNKTKKKTPIKPGQCVVTSGYNLSNEYILHCLGPRYGEDEPSDKLLKTCYENALKLADNKDIKSIGFPAISTGSFGYPLEEAAEIALKTINKELSEDCLVRFVLFDQESYKTFIKKTSVLFNK